MKWVSRDWLELVICFGIFVLVSLMSDHFQKPMTFHNDFMWDYAHYYRTAEQFARGEPIVGDAPICFRLGNPFLAARISPNDLLRGFKLVNCAANVLLLALFMVWLRLNLKDWRIRTVLVLLLLTQWHGPFRFFYWYPTASDNTLHCFILLGLICLHFVPAKPRLAVAAMTLVVLAGVLFREIVLLLPVALLFADNSIQFNGLWGKATCFRCRDIVRFPRLIFWVPFIVGVIGFACVRQAVHQENAYKFGLIAVKWLYDKPWPTYFHGALIAFGPVLALLVYDGRQAWAFLKANQPLLVFTAGMCFMAYVGGSDTERIFYWSMPVIYLLIGRAIEENWDLLGSKLLLLVLVAGQLISQRVFWILPDYPNEYLTGIPLLAPISNHFQYLDLYSLHGKRNVEVISLAEYVILLGGLVCWLAYREKNRKKALAPY